MKKVLSILLIFTTLNSFAYSDFDKFKKSIKLNRRAKYPLGINAMILGAGGHLGLSIDYFITPKFNTEIGWGAQNVNSQLLSNYFIGGKYHFFGKTISNTTIYIGIFDALNFNQPKIKHHFYLPVGITRIKKNKISWSIEIAYQVDKAYFSKSNVWGSLKIGYRFGFKKKKKK